MSSQIATHNRVLWQPSQHDTDQSHLKAFAEFVDQPLFPYDRLHRWSITHIAEFWSAVWDYAGIIGEKGDRYYTAAASMADAVFFPDASLNFAENVLRANPDNIAAYQADETGVTQAITFRDLSEQVAKAQHGLRQLGVRKGDRVAGVTTNNIDGLVALLATASLGGIWTSCSPDFGAKGIIDRIGQVQPKVLIAHLHYQYKGKPFDISAKVEDIAAQMDSIQHVVTTTDITDGAISWESLLDNQAVKPEFEQVNFSDPLYILYTSGTTGLPKAIVHSVGGTLLQHVKEHQLHGDLKETDTLFWYTNTAWMMYPWLVTGLASGASLLLYDGAPMLPDRPAHLWDIAEEIQLTHFGTSPKYLESLAKAGVRLKDDYTLSSLKSILSCGAPLVSEQYDWVYDTIKEDLMLQSISGGTEIIGCFVMGSPIHPVVRGEISCKALGMAVDVLDERGISVFGKKGDLVCTEPFPSMPLTFYGEGGDERYRNNYFSDRPGVWTHGDFAEQTIDQSLVIYGRADTVLNPGGIRIGTAEIYSVVDHIDEIQDSVVFGLPCDNDEEIVLCVVTEHLTKELAQTIRQEIRQKASPRHVPRRIYQVSDIPHTINGKKVEGAAKTTAIGAEVKNQASIRNPACLAEFSDIKKKECY